MICTDCGHKLAEGTKFCTECGIFVSNPANPVSVNSKDYLTKLLEYLRKIIHCETNLMAYRSIIQENNRAILELCDERPLPAPMQEMEELEPILKRNPPILGSAIVTVIFIAIAVLVTPFALIVLIFVALDLLRNLIAVRKSNVETKRSFDNAYDEYKKQYQIQLEGYLHETLRSMVELEQAKLYKEQSTRVNELISHAMSALSTLYGVNILHDKYRNLTAVASIYDYISTKRTYSLECTGDDLGAYNIYEEAVHFGRIVNVTVSAGARITSAIEGLSSDMRAMNVSICNSIDRASAKYEELTSQVIDGINRLNRTAERNQTTAEQNRKNNEIANKHLIDISEYNRIRTDALRDFGGIKDKTGTVVD